MTDMLFVLQLIRENMRNIEDAAYITLKTTAKPLIVLTTITFSIIDSQNILSQLSPTCTQIKKNHHQIDVNKAIFLHKERSQAGMYLILSSFQHIY